VLLIIGATVVMTTALLYVPALTDFFEFERVHGKQLTVAILSGFLSVIWYEGVKAAKRIMTKDGSADAL